MTRVAIGMFLHNEEKYVREEIESILAQTFHDFSIYILNDRSTDRTGEIVRELAKRDNRIVYMENDKRQGIAHNYRTTFWRGVGDADYFAWAAGHDIHHPQWLEKMVAALDHNQTTVLAYPLTQRVDEQGADLKIPSPKFDTEGACVDERIRAVCYDLIGAGNMIYGLFRASALRRVGVFPSQLLPDPLLLAKLGLYGGFKQISEVLWYRRFGPKADGGVDLFAWQRKTVFGRIPLYAYLPWPIAHAFSLAWTLALGPKAGSVGDRIKGLSLLSHFLKRRWRQCLPRVRYRLSNTEWLRKSYRYLVPGRSDKD